MTTATQTPKRTGGGETAESIVRNFAAWACPALEGVIEQTETIRTTLTTPVKPSNGEIASELARFQRSGAVARAQMLPSLRAVVAPRLHRERLAMDLNDLVIGAQRSLARWLTRQRQHAEVAKATIPETSDPGELAIRADAMARTQALSSLRPDLLLSDASRLLGEGRPEEADLRLGAAQMGGGLARAGPATTYGGLRRRCDDALDTVVPHRIAAARVAAEATPAYERGMAAVAEFREASRALVNADPSDPTAEVRSARALVARYAS